MTNREPETAKPGDIAQLVGPQGKHFIVRLSPGMKLETHRGILYHDDIISAPWGSRLTSHLGRAFFLLQPSLADLLTDLPRTTQIMYPKAIGFILVSMGIGPGAKVIEAGSGSGAMTIGLAFAVGSQGKVFSYEVRPDMFRLAQKNLQRVGLADRVELKQRDIKEGFDEKLIDALFLDLPNPYDFITQVRQALKPGGYFGCILPTTNQVTRLLIELQRQQFAFIEVCEISLRYYKPVPERLRPTDRMVAHTGYLIFGRPLLGELKEEPDEARESD